MKLRLNARYCFLCVLKALLLFALLMGISSIQDAKAQDTCKDKEAKISSMK